MVDFRYHLVSLISVFLALAVGVVLGAGPLQEPIASGLTSQVEVLRESQARTGAEIEQLRTDVADRNQWITETAEQVLPGTLSGKSVGLILFEDTAAEDVEAISNYIATAGGVVNQRATLTTAWSSGEMEQFRNSLAGPVVTHLAASIEAEAPASDILSEAVLEIMTSTTEETQLLREILTDSDNALITFDAEQVDSDALIFIGPRPETVEETDAETQETQAEEPVAEDTSMFTALAAAVAKAPSSGVVVGDASTAEGLVSLVRSAGVAVTSIDSVGTSMGHASTVIGLLSANQSARAFGATSTAETFVPPLPTAKADEARAAAEEGADE